MKTLKIIIAYTNYVLLKLNLLTNKKKKVATERMNICLSCNLFKNNHCTHCGCDMTKKTLVMDEKCPKGKWEKYEGI